MSPRQGSGTGSSGWAPGSSPPRSRHNLTDLSTAVLAAHVDDGAGRCRGCRRVSGTVAGEQRGPMAPYPATT